MSLAAPGASRNYTWCQQGFPATRCAAQVESAQQRSDERYGVLTFLERAAAGARRPVAALTSPQCGAHQQAAHVTA